MKTLMVSIVFSFLALGLVGPTEAQEYTFRVTHEMAAQDAINIAAIRFAERVAESSGGRIDVKVFPAAQIGHDQAGIIGQGGIAAGRRGGARLQRRVLDEADTGFLGLGQSQRRRRHEFVHIGGEQVGDFHHLALVVAGNDQPAAAKPA